MRWTRFLIIGFIVCFKTLQAGFGLNRLAGTADGLLIGLCLLFMIECGDEKEDKRNE